MSFYLMIAFYWICAIVLVGVLLMGYREVLQNCQKTRLIAKLIMMIGILLYFHFLPLFQDYGLIKPVLSESRIEELDVSEGQCSVHQSAKFSAVSMPGKVGYSFDFTLCDPTSIHEDRLDGKVIKVWHKGRMVYQYIEDGKLKLSLDEANRKICAYNIFIVPLGYLSFAVLILLSCGLCIHFVGGFERWRAKL